MSIQLENNETQCRKIHCVESTQRIGVGELFADSSDIAEYSRSLVDN
jgi:hypothetical protein